MPSETQNNANQGFVPMGPKASRGRPLGGLLQTPGQDTDIEISSHGHGHRNWH